MRLGRGAVGEVWRAELDGCAVPVALKLVNVADRALRTALLTEVRAASQLDHPNVLPILDFGELAEIDGTGPVAYVATELCSGTLRDAALRTWAEIHGLLVDLLRGLAHAHARGIVHRDMKPHNVLHRTVLGRRRWRITDLGIALLGRTLDARPASGSTGTPLYMAPEQVDGRWRDQGPWTDLYAVGCLVHELCGGRHPLAGLGGSDILARQRTADLPALEPVIDVPPGLGAWLDRMLARDVDERFSRASDALGALAALDPRPLPAVETREIVMLPGAGLSLVPLRRPSFVGRDDALARVLGELRGEGFRAVALSGRSGAGKSELARAASEALHESGERTVLWAAWSASGGPHDGLAAMLAREWLGRGLDVDGLAERFARRIPADEARDLAAVVLGKGPALDQDTWLVALQRFLEAEAARRPVLLWLDDVQWGTEGLAFVRRLKGAGCASISAVVTVRVEALADRPVEAALLAELDLPTIEVGPLSADAVDALVGSLLALEPRTAATIVERSAGSPLFAVQILADWANRRVLTPSDAGFAVVPGTRLPDDVAATWASRVRDAFDGDPPTALEVAAVLGLRVSTAEWDAACAEAGTTRDTAEERALRAGLIAKEDQDFVFVHGMLREVLIGVARRLGHLASIAAACARAVGDPRDPLRLGRLLALGPTPTEALVHLRRGAILLGQHGRSREVPGIFAEHEAIRPPDERRALAELQVIAARFHVNRGEFAAAEAAVAIACAEAEPHGWEDVLGDAELALCTAVRARGRRAEAAALAERARDRFERLVDVVGVARATALLADLAADPGTAAALAERALALVSTKTTSGALHAALLLRVANGDRMRGRIEAAEARYREVRDAYVALGDRSSLAQVLTALASIRYDLGDPDEGRRILNEALVQADRVDQPRTRAMVETFAAETALLDGDFEAAERFARSASERNHGVGVRGRFGPETVLVAIRLATGREAEARAVYDRIRRLAAQDSGPLNLEVATRLDVFELSLTDDRERYHQLYAQLRGGPYAVDTRIMEHLMALAGARARARGWL